jgi:hypothetical protein
MARPVVRTLAVLAAGTFAAAAAVSPAAATWSGSSSGSGAARATTLPAVGEVRAVCAGGGASVAVSWDPDVPATASAVWRSVDLGAWALMRAADPSTTYADSAAGLLNVSVRWRVVAVRNAWTAPESPPSPSRVISALGVCL